MEQIGAFLTAAAQEREIRISPEQAQQFQTYMELLLEWNQQMNLTAITEPKEVAVKHFLDSILILRYCGIPQGASLIDVGTGAGFPGVPLKLMRPDLRLTLLDALNKRLVFLHEVLSRLSLTAELVHARAEEAGRQKLYREKFDFAAARAVAPLNLLCEYCLPFLRTGGIFAAMKGPAPQEETKRAEHAISVLGGRLDAVKEYGLPGGGRSLILISRAAPLAPEYPRHGSRIAKKPL